MRRSAAQRCWALAEMFAIDRSREIRRAFYSGDGTRLSDYARYGAPIHAVADGTVVSAINTRPGVSPNPPRVNTTVLGPDDFSGNSVVERIAPRRYAAYAHMETGSVRVGVGQRLRAGQIRCSSSRPERNPRSAPSRPHGARRPVGAGVSGAVQIGIPTSRRHARVSTSESPRSTDTTRRNWPTICGPTVVLLARSPRRLPIAARFPLARLPAAPSMVRTRESMSERSWSISARVRPACAAGGRPSVWASFDMRVVALIASWIRASGPRVRSRLVASRWSSVFQSRMFVHVAAAHC